MNDQPTLAGVEEVLAKLPVVEAVADYDTLHLRFSRPLRASEAYLLGRLQQDTPEELDDDALEITLWWD